MVAGDSRARGVIANRDGKLTQGLFVRMRVPRATIEDALLVADRAVATDQQHRYVFVVDQEEKVQYRMLQLGQIVDGLHKLAGTFRTAAKSAKSNDLQAVAKTLTDVTTSEGAKEIQDAQNELMANGYKFKNS